MLEGEIEEWSSDFFDGVCTPVPVTFHCDDSLNRIGEGGDDSKLSDFEPPSAFQDGLTFHEMTPALVDEYLFTASEVRQGIKDVKSEDSEPCIAAITIEANLPTPDPVIVSQWRTFISTSYYHPNIMAHDDVSCLKELFQLLGSDISYDSINVMIELGKVETDNKPTYNVRPPLPASKQAPLLTFANVTDFFIDNDLQICIVKNYSINDSMKKAVSEMANFIIEYPEALYLETYGFILDFLLRFGVSSKCVIDTVVNTQRRRRKSQTPASTLVMKQANRLGKGKKEFLEKRLLDSPEKKFNPVVPLMTEPSPTRSLRNRVTGGSMEERATDHDSASVPASEPVAVSKPIPQPQASKSLAETRDLRNATSETIPGTNSFAIKRKLFHESPVIKKFGSKKRKLGGRGSGSGQEPDRSELYISPSGAKLMRRKKSFYHRRDDSQIEKPFVCKYCPERCFAYKGNLVLHMKKHHPHDARTSLSPKQREDYVPPFVCPVCQRGYSSKYKCQLHIRQFHPDRSGLEPVANENGTTTSKSTPTSSSIKEPSALGNRLSPNKIIKKKAKKKAVSNSNGNNSHGETVDIVQQCLEAADIQPGNSSRSSSSSSENSASEISVHSDTSKEQLDLHMDNGLNVSFEDISYANINHVATRQQLRTAVK